MALLSQVHPADFHQLNAFAGATALYGVGMRVAWSLLLVLLLVPGGSGVDPNSDLDPRARFALSPVAIRKASTDRRVGRLSFVRGYRLTSNDPPFGGFSSLSVEGDRFTLLNDAGQFIRFRLDSQGEARERTVGKLPAGPGTGWEKVDRDSESMTRDPATGQIWVGFETSNQIWRYSADFARPERRVQPAAMRDWPNNGGAESMIRLRSGAFLVFAEQKSGPGDKGRIGLRFDGDPTVDRRAPTRFVYLPPRGTVPSDVTELPDGRLILLNRGFSFRDGFVVVVTIVDPHLIVPGAMVRGQEIARFEGEVLHDNYEGIAVAMDHGQPVLWIVSDDNQSWFQQSLLLEFRLLPAPAQARGR